MASRVPDLRFDRFALGDDRLGRELATTARCGWWRSGISGEIRTHADTTPDYPNGPRKQTTCERETSERRARAAREQRGSSRASRWCLNLTKARASRRRAERRNKGRKWDTPPRGSGAGQSGTSTPIVLLLSRLNSLRVKRESRFDLPTPESPINTTTAHGPTPATAPHAQPPRRGNETLASEASSERHAAATSNRLVETAPSATNMCGGQRRRKEGAARPVPCALTPSGRGDSTPWECGMQWCGSLRRHRARAGDQSTPDMRCVRPERMPFRNVCIPPLPPDTILGGGPDPFHWISRGAQHAGRLVVSPLKR